VPTLFLGGDLMTGRGVDQILAHPGDARLWEGVVRDARTYVRLAEMASGAIPVPAADDWPWGDALDLLDRYGAQVRIANLETSITTHDEPMPGKAVHYRMAPGNVGCLTAARLDAVALANNHVLDFGVAGLDETRQTLQRAGIATAGAGRTAEEARQPAIVSPEPGVRVVLFSLASSSSGVPPLWNATADGPGVWLFDETSPEGVAPVLDRVNAVRRPGDIVVVSVHWGSNWGYDVPAHRVEIAHRLIDGGVDVVHGHSSHHPRPVEVYHGRLILYGVGDLIDDYEGIGGYEQYRPELRMLPLATVEAESGRLVRLRLVPVRIRRMRLRHAERDDANALCGTLNAISPTVSFTLSDDGLIEFADGQLIEGQLADGS
jgi:poly-gamma-glutamate synthesis protein (capsule biosynthesis protein)